MAPRRSTLKFARALSGSLLAATLLVSLPSWAEGVSVADATSAQHKSADKKLAEGRKLFKAGKFEAAIAAFEAAHEIVANPEARLMKARAHQNLGELVKARAAYAAAIAEGEPAVQHNEKYRDTLQSARKELKELEGVLARVTINLRHAPSGTKVEIDGEPLDTSKLGEPILLPPGAVEVTATSPDGREVKSRKLTLTAGQDAKVDLAFTRDDADDVPPSIVEEGVEAPPPDEPAPAPSSGSGKRTAAFIAGGVGVAGLATFAVFGAMSNSKYNSLDKACTGSVCPANRQDDIDAGKRDQLLANIGLVVGAVGVGASATLFLLASGDSSSSTKDKDTSSTSVELGIGFGSILVRGRFQ
jgi:hypothetical protein